MFRRFLTEEEGATAIEYGLIASLIVLVIISGMRSVAEASNANWEKINTAVEGATNP